MKKILILIAYLLFSYNIYGQNLIDSLGRKQGRWTKLESRKLRGECYYKNGLLDGQMVIFDKLGRVKKEIDYQNGKIYGKYRIYKKGILLHEISFKNNLVDGDYFLYYSDKKIKRSAHFKEGRAVSSYNYHGQEQILAKQFPDKEGVIYISYYFAVGNGAYTYRHPLYLELPTIALVGLEAHSQKVQEWMKKSEKERHEEFRRLTRKKIPLQLYPPNNGE